MIDSRSSGKKVPLVLLAGWGVNSLIWRPLESRLNDRFELHFPDLPGYGQDRDYQGSYSMPETVSRILETVPQQSIWVAWSMGATIAMQAALTNPERFLKLQIVSGTPRFMAAPDWECGMHVEPLRQLLDAFKSNYESGLKKFLLLQTAKRTVIRQQLESLLSLPAPSYSTLAQSLRLLVETDLRPSIRGLHVPTQIFAGQNDRVVPESASQWLADHIPGAACIRQPDCGHLCFLESPDEFANNLIHFAQVQSE